MVSQSKIMKKQNNFFVSFLVAIAFALSVSTVVAQTEEQKCNCVSFARSQVSKLPTGLTTWSGKLGVINHLFPRVGAVAVIDVGDDTGHVAVVENVNVASDGSLKVSIVESNFTKCQITRRTGTIDAFRIRGFYDPGFSNGSSFPRIDGVSISSVRAGQSFSADFTGSGFDSQSVRAIVLGGWCDSFSKCVVPTGSITNRSSSRVTVPMVLNQTGTYTVYLFNANNGKSSNGVKIRVR